MRTSRLLSHVVCLSIATSLPGLFGGCQSTPQGSAQTPAVSQTSANSQTPKAGQAPGVPPAQGSTPSVAQTPGGTQIPKDSQGVPMLKAIYAKDFLIGTAVDFRSANEFSPRELEILKTQFSVFTPENSMKPQIQPGPEQWNWTVADNLVNFCQENNIKVHGHTLAWHAQTPDWFFTDNGQPVTRDVAIARLKNHVETEVGHFKGKIFSWDVVNEAINDGGGGGGARGGGGGGGAAPTENLRSSPWIRAIGPDYITMAFKWAHEADPNALLFYNDYNIESGAKHQSSLVLLRRLIKDGAPINGVGIQGHWSLTGTPFAAIDQAITDYKALGLKVAISELDVTINGQGGGQLAAGGPAAGGGRGAGRGAGGAGAPGAGGPGGAGGGRGAGGAGAGGAGAGGAGAGGRGAGGRGGNRGGSASPEQLQAQADVYAKLFEIFEKHKDAVVRVTFWGLNDARSWRAGQSPLLFDGQNNAKPDLQAIADVKEKQMQQ